MRRLIYTTFLTILLSLIYQSYTITLPIKSESRNSLIRFIEYVVETDSLKQWDFPQIDIIGRKIELLEKIPGAASVISESTIKSIEPLSGNEVFKTVTGVHVVEEEGAGLRANIGLRGLDPDRSRTVLMMEDGIPIALAPYGEPEMYYTPSIDRMKSVEVLKGSGSILFGPQTIGGVINYITSDPPIDPKFNLNIRGGNLGIFSGLIGYGTSFENVGVQINYLHRKANNLGITYFKVNDLTAKIKLNFGPKSKIGLKFAAYDETSNSTYLGITQTMYDRGKYYTVVAPNDRLNIRRYSVSLIHKFLISNQAFLTTSLYAYTTIRDWLRQDFSRFPASNMTGLIWGDTSIAGGAIYMKNSTGNRNRKFDVVGIEPRFYYKYQLGSIKNEMDTGIRFLFERAYEQRINGKKFDAVSGDLREDEIRTGFAASAYLQNRFILTDKISVTPGIRIESFVYDRNISRTNFIDTNLVANDKITAFVPGLGINYKLNKNATIFSGIHRGFAPPRVKDAISNEGKPLHLNAELSWNSELGVRLNYDNFSFELTGYLLDFSNQIIPVSEASGGAGTGLVNGGRTLHKGVETSVKFDIAKLFNSNYTFIYSLNATISQAVYDADRYISDGGSFINIKGKKLPYAPVILLSSAVHFITPAGFEIQLSGNYVGKQFGDEINTIVPPADGQTGEIPAYFVTDLTGKYPINYLNSTLFISIKNLFNERYIASRRPQGIKVGLPRTITAGVELSL